MKFFITIIFYIYLKSRKYDKEDYFWNFRAKTYIIVLFYEIHIAIINIFQIIFWMMWKKEGKLEGGKHILILNWIKW